MNVSQKTYDDANFMTALNDYVGQQAGRTKEVSEKNELVNQYNDRLRMGIEPIGAEFGRAGVEGLSGKFRGAVTRGIKSGIDGAKKEVTDRIGRNAKSIAERYNVDEDKVRGFLQRKQSKITDAFGERRPAGTGTSLLQDIPQGRTPLTTPPEPQVLGKPATAEGQRIGVSTEPEKPDLPSFPSMNQTDEEKGTSGVKDEPLTKPAEQEPNLSKDEEIEKKLGKFGEGFGEGEAEGGGPEDVLGDIAGIGLGIASVFGEKKLEKKQVTEDALPSINPSAIKGI
ncbi:MAG: hypothetical protein ACXAAH_06110 [Promethearchaeota archaeon]|jgi:hypothetical protein